MENHYLIRSPFNSQLQGSIPSVTKEKQLIDLSSKTPLKIKFLMPLSVLIGVQNEYKELGEEAMQTLIPLATSYLVKQDFQHSL
jgi:hypothetical protein